MKLSKIAFRNIFRKPVRSIISIVAIFYAAMGMVFLFGLIGGMKNEMAENIQVFSSGDIRIRSEEYNKWEILNPLHFNVDAKESLLASIKAVEGVEDVHARISFTSLYSKDGKNTPVLGVGLDFTKELGLWDPAEYLIEGTLPVNGEKKISIGSELAEKLGLGIGDKFTIMSKTGNRRSNGMTFTVSGLMDYPLPSWDSMTFLVPYDTASRTLYMKERATDLLVSTEKGAQLPKVAEEINKLNLFASPVEIQPWNLIPSWYNYIQIAEIAYTIMSFIFFALASTVIITTTMMVIAERKKEIGTLGALGMKPKELTSLFFTESSIIGFVGAFSGVLLASLAIVALGDVGIDLSEMMAGIDMGISGVLRFSIQPFYIGFVFFASWATASFTSLIPSRKAAKIKPVEALRNI
jgi:putative ABC transport system permease protein